MNADIYESLASALDALPNGFPRTPSNAEITILKRMFTPGQAAIGAHLTHQPEAPSDIADRAGLPAEDAEQLLKQMARRGLVWPGDVRPILESAKAFSARDCICRAQQDHVGRKCDFPLKNCLSFSSAERASRPNDIPKGEALDLFDQTEEIGLVHTVSNVMEGLSYVCNCCGCCCGILRGITEWGIQNSVAAANYCATIDPEECTGCGDCIKRCQLDVISSDGDTCVVDRARCIGCGLCVTGCPGGAAQLERKPEDEIVVPPLDFATWEQDRLANRGLTG